MVDTVTSGEDQGANFLAQIDAEQRKTSAYNALNKQYGPGIAGDPQAAADAAKAALLQSTQASTADLTNETNQQQGAGQAALVSQYGAQAGSPETTSKVLGNEDTANQVQRNAQTRAIKMLGNSVDQQSGAVDGAAFDQLITPNAKALGFTDASQVAQLRAQLTAPGGGQHLDTLATSLQAPVAMGSGAPVVIKNPDGTNTIRRYDKNGNPIDTTLAPGQVPVTQQNANSTAENAATNRMGVPIKQENANTAAYSAGTRANNSNFGNPNGGAPGQGGAAPASANPPPGHGPNPDGTATTPQFEKLAPVGSKARSTAIGNAQQIVNSDTMVQNFNNVAAQALQQIPAGAGAGDLIKDLPGSVQKNLEANLLTMKSGELTAWVASMKNASGQTGMGRILLPEVNAAMSAFGNMDQGQTVGQLKYHLQIAQQAINQLHSTAATAFKSQWGQDPYALLGAQPGQGGSGTPAKQGGAGPQKITSNADYAALKSGTQFLAPDGTTRTKP